MALIKQIEVGGTTYYIGVRAIAPLIYSGDSLKLSLGTGLQTEAGRLDVFLSGFSLEHKNGVAVKVGSGMQATAEGITLLISGADRSYNRGLSLDRGMLTLKIGSGLRFNEDGSLDLAVW